MTRENYLKLILPKRYEYLERAAEQKDVNINHIVQRVDSAATRIEILMRQVRDGGIGRFELFEGKSGAGKTTFFKTLSMFFSGVNVKGIDRSVPLEEVADHIRKFSTVTRTGNIDVWVLYDRDNPKISEEEAEGFFESLRVLFREPRGKTVLVWPITSEKMTKLLAKAAWEIGRDSVVDLFNKGIYRFAGLSKDKYYEVADITTRSLNGGQSLEAFGLTEDVADSLISEADTISAFYSYLENKSNEINENFRDVLQEKPIPHVWILVAGDDNRDLNPTIASLTQGTEKQVDIDRLSQLLDDPTLDAIYLQEWKKRRNQMAYLMRFLDVRLFELSPNVALAAIRAFGADDVKTSLKSKNISKSRSAPSLLNAHFYRLLIENNSPHRLPRATKQSTAQEYIRVQQQAKVDDKELNKALAQALKYAFLQNGIEVSITAEKKLMEGNLKPDILLEFPDGRLICLEITWRTTGKGIDGEVDKQQNTLTVGHIQQYLLDKVLQYVKDMEL